MYKKMVIAGMLFLSISHSINAQTKALDSAAVVKTFTELITACKNVDFSDPQVTSLGTFYKAAKYIVYSGDDETRAWKDFVNYNDPKEKESVNNVCEDINQTANQDSSYKITKYLTKKESEGLWHILQLSYMKNGKRKNVSFAFLKIKGGFGLGDID